jgi:hypothetical protein
METMAASTGVRSPRDMWQCPTSTEDQPLALQRAAPRRLAVSPLSNESSRYVEETGQVRRIYAAAFFATDPPD